MVSKNEIIDISLKLFRVIGMHPDQKFVYMTFVICNGLFCFGFLCLTIRLIYESIGDVNMTLVAIGAVFPFVQFIMKLFPFVVHRKHIKALTKNYGIVGRKDKDISIFKIWKKVLLFYRNFLILESGSAVIGAMVTFTMPIAFYVPDVPYGFMFIIFQYPVMGIGCIIVIASDLFFISMCLIIWQEFTELQESCLEMNGETNEAILRSKYKNCIQRHIDLLDYVTHLTEAYSLTLLSQYVVSMFSICVSVYILEESTDMAQIIPTGLYTIAVLFQQAVYCLSADEVTQKASQLAISVYCMEWYKHPISLQKNILLIIQRSQVPFLFMGGGMLIINREAYTNIFRGALSFYTLVQQLKES